MQCDQCRYALDGLPLDGTCPECGLGIAETIRRANKRAAARANSPRLTVLSGTLFGVLVGVVSLLVVMFTIGPCGGDPEFAWLFFPAPIFALRLTESIGFAILLAILQFPIYGAFIGACWNPLRRARWAIFALPVFHFATFALLRSQVP